MRTYSHSGAVPPSAAALTIAVGLAAAIGGGFVYAYAFYWIAVGFLRIMMTMFYGGLMGVCIAWAARRGKIRSPAAVTVVALACFLMGMWTEWGASDWARNGPVAGASAWTPARLAGQAQNLFENGSWRIRRNVVKGWPLVGFWIAEAGVIGWICLTSARADARRPFCESCQAWTDSTSGLMHFAATGQEPAWQEVLNGELPAIADFPPSRAAQAETVRLDLATCPQCEHSSFLTLTAIKVTTNSKGKTKTTERTMIASGVLTASEAEFLRQFAGQQASAAEAAGEHEDLDGDETPQ